MTTARRRLEVLPGGATSDGADPREPAFEEEGSEMAAGLLYNVAGVRIEGRGVVEHDAGDFVYARGVAVACEGPEGVVRGVVVVASRRRLAEGPLPRIVRASTLDRAGEAELRAREQAVTATARAVVRNLGAPVKVVRAEALGGGPRFAVYFASETKFSFQEVLLALARATDERVELRQVGLRDATKILGGVGPCGLQLCCNTFLADFAPVTVKMAKDQGLGVNPQKLSGLCGRLLCCLVYEEAFYREQRARLPAPGARVSTERGYGRVREIDVLEMTARVALDSGEVVVLAVAELTPGASVPS